jgi:hypothetical protein
MKLHDLAAPRPSKQIAKVFESYFGTKIPFDSLNARQTQHLLKRVRGLLGEHRSTPARHHSEQNASYLKLVMMEQALTQRMAEETIPVAPVAGVAPGAKPAQPSTVQVKDPKLAAALKKSTAGQTLTPDEQKLVAGAAMMQAESRLRRAMTRLNESEVQQAQVVLAAQDMVDKMQGMLEDVTELQFKELPALVDSIKNQVGIEQAQQFNSDVSTALTTLVQGLQAAKAQLDQALGVVTGQTPAMPGIPGMDAAGAADAGAEMGAEMDGEPGAEMGAEAGADLGDELDQVAADAGAAELGRKRR